MHALNIIGFKVINVVVRFFNQDYDHADPCVLMSLKKTPPSHFSQTFLLLKVWVNQGYIKIELDSY